MRNRYGYLLVILALALVLTGCVLEDAPQTTAPTETEAVAETTVPAETTLPAETEAPTEMPTEEPTQAPATVPAETEAQSHLPYIQRIDRADQSIFDGPGYDYSFAGTVRERGAYTIVEEAEDEEGNLWGKLKSGAGWVDLTQIRSEEYAKALLSANYADDNLLFHGDYHHCPGSEQEFNVSIAFRAYGKLQNVTLFHFEFTGEDYAVGEAFYTLEEMTEEMPLVADLAFPGDMSRYGIHFTDETGEVHIYSIYLSGRNGSVVMEPYAP